MIQFNCPFCGKTIAVGDEGAGKKGKCPGCSLRIRVPETTVLEPPKKPPVIVPQSELVPCEVVPEPAVIPSLPATQISQHPQPLIGVTDAVCPYCDHRLEKMPGRKKKCPACGNDIFVRTRPQDKVRILVRGDQLLAIQEQWSIVNGTKDGFLQSSFGSPVAIEKVKILVGRDFTELKGVTEAMSQEITRQLVDGLARGENPHTIARKMHEAVDGLGQRRATSIARTEIMRAHAEGQLDAMENLGVEKVGVAVEWST